MTQSTKKVSAVTAAIAVALLAFWYVGLFRPQTASLHKASAAYGMAQRQEDQLKSQVSALEALERQVPQDTAKLAAFDAAVPKTPDLQDMLDQLHTLAVSTGVELTTLSPSLPGTGTATTGSPEVQLNMSVSGSYAQLRSFITGLDSVKRVVVVTQLAISGSGGTLTASIAAHMFYAP